MGSTSARGSSGRRPAALPERESRPALPASGGGRLPLLFTARAAVATAWLLALALLAGGCGAPRPAGLVLVEMGGRPLRVAAETPADSTADALIAPYRHVVEERMGEPLAISPAPLQRGAPEGPLGSLIADMVLARARAESGLAVDACLLNNGGLRISWPEGPITLGLVYEVMPFDNALALLRLSAGQVRALADQIAERGGEPLSGMLVRVRRGEDRAREVRVGGEPLAERDYWIVTSDYLAYGGGGMPALWEPLERRTLPLLIRDAIADACRAYGAAGEPGELGRLPLPEGGRFVVEGGGSR